MILTQFHNFHLLHFPSLLLTFQATIFLPYSHYCSTIPTISTPNPILLNQHTTSSTPHFISSAHIFFIFQKLQSLFLFHTLPPPPHQNLLFSLLCLHHFI